MSRHCHGPRTVVRLLLACSLAAPGLSHAGLFDKAPPPPLVLQADSVAAEVFRQAIDDGNPVRSLPKPYAGPSNKVAIGMVRLNFITDTSDSARTQEFMGKTAVTVSSQMKLLGVAPAQMTALAVAFHAALRQQLAAQGYEVVPQEQLLALPDFRKAVDDTPPVGNSLIGSVTSVYAPGTGNLQTFGMRNFAFEQKMPVVLANLTINFAAFDKNTDRWAQGGYAVSASIESRATTVVGGYLRVMTEDGGGPQFDLLRPVVLPGAFAERVQRVEKSGAEVAAVTTFKVLGALLGSKESSSSERYEVIASPNYEAVMTADLQRFAAVTAQVLKKRD